MTRSLPLPLLLLASATGIASAADGVWPASPYHHVLILTIDGFREADLEDPALAADLPNIRALRAEGISFTSATSPTPTDSFPGLLSIVTGANPRTTGVYYDDTYSRALYPAGTTLDGSGTPNAPAGVEIPWTEAITINSAVLNGIAANPNPAPPLASSGYDASSISAAKLPLRLVGSGPSATLVAFHPHEWLKVNTIFEVARAAGLRTAWSDKHPSYEILNGPSGAGLDDFFAPESEAKIIATPPSDRIDGIFTLVDGGANKASKSQGGSMGQDDLRVQAVLNQLHGRAAKGAAVTGDIVPAIFGMNFIAVNSASKFDTTAGSQPDNSLTTGSQLNGGIDDDGTVSANLHEAFAHTDASVGAIVAEMKSLTDLDGRSVYDNTLIVVTAKHGNSPRLGKATVMPPDWFSTTTSAQAPAKYSAVISYPGAVAPLSGIAVARATQDASAILWLADQSQTATAVANLQTFAAANPTLIDSVVSGSGIPALSAGMGDPATDDRAPDIIVKLKPSVIVATSLKRAEHGGFSDDERHVPLVLAGGLPAAARGTTRAAAVSTTQIAPTALRALGLDPSALAGAKAEGTVALGGVLDQPPVAIPDTLLAQKNGKLVVPSTALSANDTDPDGDPLLVTAVSPTSAAGGTVALVDGKVVYTPPTGFTGLDTFTYTVRDGARVSGPMANGEQLGWADVGHTIPLYRGGYGSSLAAAPGHPGEYYALADRGPNGDTSGIASGPALSDPNAKIFADPGYAPEIAHVRWDADGSIVVLGTIVLQTAGGAPLTGLPNHLNGSTLPPTAPIIDVGYDTAGTALAVDPNGIDSEGLVALPDGTFWISDEYGPYLVHVDATGKTLEHIDPFTANAQGHKLPAVLALRLTNKGMEGLTVTPDGSLLVGMMQSALVNDPVNDPIGNPYVTGAANTYGKNNKKNLLLRVVTYRLLAGGGESVGQSHQYAYLLGDPSSAAPPASGNKQAVSEITALSNTDFLVDERDGNFASDVGGAVKKTWRFTLTGATAIDDGGDAGDGLKVMVGGTTPTTLETLVYNKKAYDAKAALATYGIVPLAKESAPKVDLGLIGAAYDHDKIEGVLAANGRVVYSNDDDFGLDGAAAKVIPGSYPVGNLAAAAVAGQTSDYGQLLEVDPAKLLFDVGVVTVSVTVAGNAAPTIADVADHVTGTGVATSAIPVAIGDAETPAGSLTLSAASSDASKVASAGIALGGSGAARTVTVTPLAGQTGPVTITLTVMDAQGLTASDSFVLAIGGVSGATGGTAGATAGATGGSTGDGNGACGLGGGATAALLACLGLWTRRRRE